MVIVLRVTSWYNMTVLITDTGILHVYSHRGGSGTSQMGVWGHNSSWEPGGTICSWLMDITGVFCSWIKDITGLFKWKSREAGPKWGEGPLGATFFIGGRAHYPPVEPPLYSQRVLIPAQVRQVMQRWGYEAIVTSDALVTSRLPVIPAEWRHWSWRTASRLFKTDVRITVRWPPRATANATTSQHHADVSITTSPVLVTVLRPVRTRRVNQVETRLKVLKFNFKILKVLLCGLNALSREISSLFKTNDMNVIKYWAT